MINLPEMRFRATVENIPTFFREFIASRPFFLLSSVQVSYRPSRSYKRNASSSLQRTRCTSSVTMTPTKAASRSGRKSLSHGLFSLPDSRSSVVKVESLFTNYRIQSNADNKITMSLSTEALLSALRSSSSSASSSSIAAAILPTHDADELVMKLAKKNDQAVLSFEMLGVSRTGRKVRVAHDVRIDVMRPSEVDKLREPLCPEPDVCFLNFRTEMKKLKKPWARLPFSCPSCRRCALLLRDSALSPIYWLLGPTTVANSKSQSVPIRSNSKHNGWGAQTPP